MSKTQPSKTQKWWSNGVRFECQGSGKCCVSRGEYGFVYLNTEDRKRLASHLDLTLTEFTRKHCTKTLNHTHLKDPDKTCHFLKNNRCSVYEARPMQCRTWPFWPEHMSAKKWAVEVASYCPGVGKGPLIPAEKIKQELATVKAWEKTD